MQLKINNFLPLAFGTILIWSCHDKIPGLIKSANKDSKNNPSYTGMYVQYDSGVTVRDQYLLNCISELVGLPAIKNESIMRSIRIWVWDIKPNIIVDISENEKNWTVNAIKFSLEFDTSWVQTVPRKRYRAKLFVQSKSTNLQPKLGWPNFTAQIEKRKIYELTGGRINDEREVNLTSSNWMQIELGQKNRYQFLQYLQPSYLRQIRPESKTVYEFLEYLASDFEINMLDYFESNKKFVKARVDH